LKQQLILTIPIEIEMSDILASDEVEFVREAMKASPIQIGREYLTEQKTWFAKRWHSQVALQQVLRDSPVDLLQFFGILALQDLTSSANDMSVMSLNDALLPTIRHLELENDFYPKGLDADAALVETALDLLESVQVNFGVPSISAKDLASVMLCNNSPVEPTS